MSGTGEVATVVAIFLMALALAIPVFTATVAESKGYSAVLWFVGGLLFGPIALIAAVGMGPNRYPEIRARRGRRSSLKICGYCDEPARVDAWLCPHCRMKFEEGEAE